MGFRSSRKESRKNFKTLLTFILYIVPVKSVVVNEYAKFNPVLRHAINPLSQDNLTFH